MVSCTDLTPINYWDLLKFDGLVSVWTGAAVLAFKALVMWRDLSNCLSEIMRYSHRGSEHVTEAALSFLFQYVRYKKTLNKQCKWITWILWRNYSNINCVRDCIPSFWAILALDDCDHYKLFLLQRREIPWLSCICSICFTKALSWAMNNITSIQS